MKVFLSNMEINPGNHKVLHWYNQFNWTSSWFTLWHYHNFACLLSYCCASLFWTIKYLYIHSCFVCQCVHSCYAYSYCVVVCRLYVVCYAPFLYFILQEAVFLSDEHNNEAKSEWWENSGKNNFFPFVHIIFNIDPWNLNLVPQMYSRLSLLPSSNRWLLRRYIGLQYSNNHFNKWRL